MKKPLSAKAKKGLVYGGLGVVAVATVYVATLSTEKAPPIKEPTTVSLTGNVDTRAVSIEGFDRRLSDLEAAGIREQDDLRRDVARLEATIANLNKQIEADRKNAAAELKRQLAEQAAKEQKQPKETPDFKVETKKQVQPVIDEQAEIDRKARELAAKIEAEKEERARRESIYKPATQPPSAAQSQAGASNPAPRIAVFASPEPDPKDKREEMLDRIPDVQIPAGSILTAYLITGLDAPTGARASQQPVPVLMRIKKEAILPNKAFADVVDCHLLGSAYGDLGSERVNIRGETVSCILADNTAIEGSVKFFAAGADGKNGVKGNLVSRSGRILAAAAGTAMTQGIFSALESGGEGNVFLGGAGGGSGGAVAGASKGFDLLTEYYLELAEQTFPVIEIPNGQWVDVVLTEMLTVKFKG